MLSRTKNRDFCLRQNKFELARTKYGDFGPGYNRNNHSHLEGRTGDARPGPGMTHLRTGNDPCWGGSHWPDGAGQVVLCRRSGGFVSQVKVITVAGLRFLTERGRESAFGAFWRRRSGDFADRRRYSVGPATYKRKTDSTQLLFIPLNQRTSRSPEHQNQGIQGST